MTTFFNKGYATYPKPADPTEDLEVCETEEAYMKAFNEWSSGYDKAAADDTALENAHYDDAQL